MAYAPTFDRNPQGKFNEKALFKALVAGTNSYFLEDEFNESQAIANYNIEEIVRKLFYSGQVNYSSISNLAGASLAEGAIGASGQNNIIEFRNLKFVIDGESAVLTGDYNSVSGLFSYTLPGPPSSGTRTDLVILEKWVKIISGIDTIYAYGGLQNPSITNQIIDPRVNADTTRRQQIQWRVRTIQGVSTLAGAYVQGPLTAPSGTITYSAVTNDTGVYTATDPSLGTVENIVYAIELCTVSRTAGITAINLADVVDKRKKSGFKVANMSPYTAAHVGLTITGLSGQTADLQQWVDNTGSVKASINKDGYFGIGTAPSVNFHVVGTSNLNGVIGMGTQGPNSAFGQVAIGVNTTTRSALYISQGVANATAPITVIKLGVTPGTGGDALQIQDSNGTKKSLINSVGSFVFRNTADTSDLSWFSKNQLQVASESSGSVVMITRGAVSQTADLQQWQDSTGSVKAKVDPAGSANFTDVSVNNKFKMSYNSTENSLDFIFIG